MQKYCLVGEASLGAGSICSSIGDHVIGIRRILYMDISYLYNISDYAFAAPTSFETFRKKSRTKIVAMGYHK